MTQAPKLPRDERGYTRSEIISGARVALNQEISGLLESLKSWGGDTPQKIVATAVVDKEALRYALTLERPVRPPELAGVEISLEGMKIRGSVEQVSANGLNLLVALDSALPPDALGTIGFDVTRILKALSNRLLSLEKNLPDDLPQGVLDPWLGLGEPILGRGHLEHASSQELNEDQQDAIMTALGSPATFTFGPPGTGKTKTLGSLVAELAESRGVRVLVVAHTNVAVDTALAAVARAVSEPWRDGRHIMRAGFTSAELAAIGVGRADMLPDKPAETSEALDRFSEYGRVLSLLEAKLGHPGDISLPLRSRAAALNKLTHQLPQSDQDLFMDLVEDIDRLSSRYFQSVPVIGATLSWLALYGNRMGDVDTVVLDEAGMTLLPQAILAGSLPAQSIAAFGDPHQLPPLTQAQEPEAREILSRHPYAQASIAGPKEADARRPLLTIQYRMRPSIRALVSELFYSSTLQDSPERASTETAASLWLIDTTLAGTKSAPQGTSRRNKGSAQMVVNLVKYLSQKNQSEEIAILTPFRAQMKEIKAVLSSEGLSGQATVHTIHQVQGGEFQTIILDLVDTPPQFGTFLQEHLNPDLPNLLCVALSRAKERLFVIAHDKGFRQNSRMEDSLVIRLLDTLRQEGMTVSPSSLELPMESDELAGEAESRSTWDYYSHEGYGENYDPDVWVEPA